MECQQITGHVQTFANPAVSECQRSADQDAYPDFDVFVASAEDELRALAASA
jgi:hypothetical protein